MSTIPSKLDERQVLQNVHDEDRKTLRVDATVFLDGAGPLGDNVSIVGETGDKLVVNPDGSINVNNTQIILNIKEQIMRAVDREQNIIYEDFGTKNQRIVEINYNAISVGLPVAKKTITYTLVGNKYRRDSIDWSII